MIKVENLYKMFRKKTALDGIDLRLDEGIYGVLGPNGAGKTTLIRCITGLYGYEKGELFIDDLNMRRQRGNVKNIGYLPQRFGTYRELTMKEAMKFFCILKNIDDDDSERQIDEALKKVNLAEHKTEKVKTLSGGMLRRLGIAQALLGDPKILIFDEPTAGLDPEERLRLKKIIADVSKDKTVLISTHIVEDVEALCDKIIVMSQGKILEMGTNEDISNFAKGKVYLCEAAAIGMLDKKQFIEKEYDSKGKVFLRVLSRDALPFEPVQATIEDGYLCILKDI